MLSYLVTFIQAFIPLAVVTGMHLAFWRPVRGRKVHLPLLLAAGAGLLAGLVLYPVSFRQGILTSARASLCGTAILAVAAGAVSLLLLRKRGGIVSAMGWWSGLFCTATLAAVTGFSFLGRVYEQTLTSTSVLNTELILNISGILAGLFLMTFLVTLAAQLGTRTGRGLLVALLLFAYLLLAVQWSADVLLALMRLEVVQLTSLRLTFVAKAGKYANFFPYLQALLIAVLSLGYFSVRSKVPGKELDRLDKAARRKARSGMIFELRWFKAALALVAVILTVLLYHDLYANRPPKISKPVPLTPDAAGLIRVKVADVMDGNLHRYCYVTDDGHVVRFFLINRSKGQAKLGVVYDACMLCGDMGYIQEKNEIICIACNVRIFIPSIGKAGGCNPIPLMHSLEGEDVVVKVQELDNGARYFSEVVAKKVKDPVTGKEVDSSKAPTRYEFKGRTYFFESPESAEKFKQAPERYIGPQQSRYERVQGFRES